MAHTVAASRRGTSPADRFERCYPALARADRAGRRHHDRHRADQYPRHPSGLLSDRQDDAQAICGEVGAPNLQVQFDCYHCHIVEGDLAVTLKRDMPRIGHIQIAGAPERHESDIGELNYPYLFDLIDALGHEGWTGCEYRPCAGTSAGLSWVKPYLRRNV
nr:TIM barrel protein [Paraburkholderia terrae]